MRFSTFNSQDIIGFYKNNANVIALGLSKAYKLQKISSIYGVMPDTLREITCHKRINNNNANLIKMYDIYLCVFDNEIYMCTELELCEPICKTSSILMFLEILNAIKYLHELGYIHGDLASNIMMKGESIRVIDFGLSQKKYRSYDYNYKPNVLSRPLELNINSNNININTIDSFSLGNIYYMLLTGNYMFDFNLVAKDSITKHTITNTSLTEEIISKINISQKYCEQLGLYKPSSNNKSLSNLNSSDKKIIGNLIQHNPFNRTTVSELVNIMIPYAKFNNFKFYDYKIENYKSLKVINNIDISIYINKLENLKVNSDILYNICFNLLRIKHNNIDELFCVLFWIHHKLGTVNIKYNDVLRILGVNYDIIMLELEILQNNKFNVDSFNAYDLILEFPKKIRYNVHQNLLQLLDAPYRKYNTYSELLKVLYLYNKYKISNSFTSPKLEELKLKLQRKLNIDITDIINQAILKN